MLELMVHIAAPRSADRRGISDHAKTPFFSIGDKHLPVVQLSHEKERQCPKTLKDGTHDSFSRLGFYTDDAFAEKNWITVAAAIKKVKSATEKTEACCFSPAITFDGGK